MPSGVPAGGHDVQFIIYVYEHLHQTLMGSRHLQDLQIFYPWDKSLGFSEAFILFQIFYSPLRWMSLSPALAYTLTLMASGVMGFTSLSCILRFALRIERWLVVFITAGFHFGGFLVANIGHSQVFTIEFIIFSCWLFLYGFCEKHRFLISASGVVYSLSFVTSFYMTWLFSLIMGTAVLVGFGLRPCLQWFRSRLGLVFAFSALPGILLTLLIYIPAYTAGGRRKMGEVITNALSLMDLLRFPGSFSLGQFLPIDINCEHYFGLPLSLVGSVFILLGLLFKNRMAQRKQLLKLFAITIVFVCLILKFSFWGEKEWTGWGLIYNLIPGGHAIRAPGRIMIILVLFWLGIFAASLRQLWTQYRYTLIFMTLLIFIEQLKPMEISSFKEPEPTQPPTTCRAFFITPVESANQGRIPTQIEAMWIAMKSGIPTLNGYSGAYPPNYSLMDEEIPFQKAVEDWTDSQNLNRQQICEYLRETNRWVPANLQGRSK
jgi:hypothetical protein